MKKQNKEIDVVFLLDRSGSMRGMEDDTIGGFNSYIESQKNKNVKVTTVLFDDKYEILHDRVDIKKINLLTKEEYYVRGCTALLDSVGKTIKKIESSTDNKVIFIITTDGLENASHEYNKSQIKEMIEGHNDWEFMFIGANIDSYSEGSSLGIKSTNICNYEKNSKGVKKLFSALGKASNMVYEDSMLDESWKCDLEDYINKNKGI